MYSSEVQIINQLIEEAELTKGFEPPNSAIRLYQTAAGYLTYRGQDKIERLEKGLDNIYKSNSEVLRTWTGKKVKEDILSLVAGLKNKRACEEQDIKKMLDGLLSVKVEESEILFEIYGCNMNRPTLSFGDFIIYSYDKSIDSLIAKYPALSNKELFFSHKKSEYYVGIKVWARENARAVELAEEYCKVFENVFSYVIGDITHKYSVGVFNFRGWSTIDHIVCNNNSMSLGFENNISLKVDIEREIFTDSKLGNEKIWSLITKENKSEIERRLLNSIEWIGKAVHELDSSKSLVQFVFAIECMLQYNDKSMITPSIVSQISDWIAFVIQDDPRERKRIAKFFKDIYQKRSLVAHGKSANITFRDLDLANQLSRLMVTSFLTIKPFCEMNSMQELNDHIADLKFK